MISPLEKFLIVTTAECTRPYIHQGHCPPEEPEAYKTQVMVCLRQPTLLAVIAQG